MKFTQFPDGFRRKIFHCVKNLVGKKRGKIIEFSRSFPSETFNIVTLIVIYLLSTVSTLLTTDSDKPLFLKL